jgi:hypothetical protein
MYNIDSLKDYIEILLNKAEANIDTGKKALFSDKFLHNLPQYGKQLYQNLHIQSMYAEILNTVSTTTVPQEVIEYLSKYQEHVMQKLVSSRPYSETTNNLANMCYLWDREADQEVYRRLQEMKTIYGKGNKDTSKEKAKGY